MIVVEKLQEGDQEEEEDLGKGQTEDLGSQLPGHRLGGMTVIQHGNSREEVEEGDHSVLGLTREISGLVTMGGAAAVLVEEEDMEHMSLTVLLILVGGDEGIRGPGGEETAGLIRGEDTE